jgi:hypothetical protein
MSSANISRIAGADAFLKRRSMQRQLLYDDLYRTLEWNVWIVEAKAFARNQAIASTHLPGL